MKIYHVSDLHTKHPEKAPNNIDLIINTGDWLPIVYDSIYMEIAAQKQWLEQEVKNICDWTNSKLMLFVDGNHESINPAEILSRSGIKIINVTNKMYTHPESGMTFYGFPYVPYIGGRWNYEESLYGMYIRFQEMIESIKDNKILNIDVLMCHCPPYGIFDLNEKNEHCGNKVLTEMIDSGEFKPRYILCGHMHGNAGICNYKGVTISNAAIISQILDLTVI